MDDLISRTALVNALTEAQDCAPTLCGRPIIEVSDMIRMIEDAPSVDAEPVIRCKHCAHCVPLQDGKSFYCKSSEMEFYAPYYDMATYFCGDREAKTNAGTTASYRRTDVPYGETAQMQ